MPSVACSSTTFEYVYDDELHACVSLEYKATKVRYNKRRKTYVLEYNHIVYTALRVIVRLSSSCFSSSVGGTCLSGLKVFFPRKSGLAVCGNAGVSFPPSPSGSLSFWFVAIWMMRKMEHMATMTICKKVPHESSNSPAPPPLQRSRAP